MRYYAHFGHKDFVLCMGYGARHITRYFLDDEETRSNDFVLDSGEVRPLSTDIADWRMTFCNKGLNTPIGERLRQVACHLDDEPLFLANHADVLTDAPLDLMIDQLTASDALASLLTVPPHSSFYVVRNRDDDRVSRIESVADLPLRENGAYFVFRRELLSHLEPGADLVGDTLSLTRLAALAAFPWDLVLALMARTRTRTMRYWVAWPPPRFRDHLILHYEVPKWDGDLGSLVPNLYIPLSAEQVRDKWDILDEHYISQKAHDWWDAETFAGFARLRGIECRSHHAEAFRVTKITLGFCPI